MATSVGSVIDDKYEILKQIGKGGMSTVYLAMDKRLNKQWAVKEIRKTASGKNDEIIINSLLAEANLMKRLDHPALPRIVDIIEDNQTIYVVMDYIEGESLDKILDTYGPQPQEVVIEWAKQLCDALGYLHSQKPPIIYRDMKPANIMLKPEGNLKVIDFGIAREYKEANLADTTVLGTRGYAPPEQHGSRQTDGRSDIYALGMTMHHLLTGVDPRPADYQYVSIRQWNPELSAGLERIIDKCTALDPEDRYQNASELMYALDHYEEEDVTYKKRQKRKLLAFVLPLGISILFFISGFVFLGQRHRVITNDYEAYIDHDYNGDQEDENGMTGEDYFREAIKLQPDRPEAYLALLEYYRTVGFDEENAKTFMAIFNTDGASLDKNTEEYWEICDTVGRMYLFEYSLGEDTDSFKTRVALAATYFKKIENADSYSDISFVKTYLSLNDFCQNYLNQGNINDPTKDVYEDLLVEFDKCLDDIDEYKESDSNYIQLEVCQEIMNVLNSHRKGFAKTGVEKSAVLDILNRCYEKATSLQTTLESTEQLQENIESDYEDDLEGIESAYESASDSAYSNKEEATDEN